jgi:hypothetical protein
MGYIHVASDDFSEDHTQDPTWWVWKGNRVGELAPVVVDGQLTIPHIESDTPGTPGDVVFGMFMGGAAVDRLAQRMTVKFSKSALDQWIYAAVRVRDTSPETFFSSITGYAGPYGTISIQSDGGTSVVGGNVQFEVGAWYWVRVTIDDFHTVIVEIFDNAELTNSLSTFSSELPDDSDEFRSAPGIGGIIATAGVIIDEVSFDRLELVEEPPNEYDEYYYVGTSILTTTKKMLGLSLEDHSFDHDVITSINSAFNTLQQIGIGATGFAIEDETLEWSDFSQPFPQFNLIKSFVYLYTRLFFDPPTTTFHLNAAQEQLKELTWRLSVAREETDWVDPTPPIIDPENVVVVFDGGGAAG